MKRPTDAQPLLIHERVRLEKLIEQFSPTGRTRIRLDNVDTVKVNDVLRYYEDHGYQGGWDVTGAVTKITDKSLVLVKLDGSRGSSKVETSRIAKDDRLARRRVVRLGTIEEHREYQDLSRRKRAEDTLVYYLDTVAKERESVQRRIESRATAQLLEEVLSEPGFRMRLDTIKTEIAAQYRDCEACGWPGRREDTGCLRCSDGY